MLNRFFFWWLHELFRLLFFLCSIGITYYDHLLFSRFFFKIILSLKLSLSTVVSLFWEWKWVWMFFWKGQVSGVPKSNSVDKGFHLKGPSWGAHQGVWIVLSILRMVCLSEPVLMTSSLSFCLQSQRPLLPPCHSGGSSAAEPLGTIV